jgi:hypothetical protein
MSGPPTLEEIQTAVILDTAQTRVVSSALDDWNRRAEKSWRGGRGMGRGPRDGSGMGSGKGSGMGMGHHDNRRHGEGRRGGGEGFGDDALHGVGYRQALQFVADVAPSLDNEQLASLSRFLADRRAGAMADRNGGGVPGMRGMNRLDLSAEQEKALDAMRERHWAAMREVREGFLAGQVEEASMVQTVKAMRTAMEDSVATILNEEQFAQWKKMRDEMSSRMAEQHMKRLGNGVPMHVDWLTNVLTLNDEQQEQVTAILEAGLPRQREILEEQRDGKLSRDEAWEKLHSVRDANAESIRKVLTEQQRERLEAVQPLLPRGRHAVG